MRHPRVIIAGIALAAVAAAAAGGGVAAASAGGSPASRPGQVSGQAAEGFFVATPGLTPIAGSPAGSVPAAPPGAGLGY